MSEPDILRCKEAIAADTTCEVSEAVNLSKATLSPQEFSCLFCDAEEESEYGCVPAAVLAVKWKHVAHRWAGERGNMRKGELRGVSN